MSTNNCEYKRCMVCEYWSDFTGSCRKPCNGKCYHCKDTDCENHPNAEFAKVSWQVGDVLEAAKERGISLTEQKAAELLESVEQQLSEAMIATGWGVIYEALSELKPNN